MNLKVKVLDFVQLGGACRAGRLGRDSWRHHFRHLPQRPRLLAQHTCGLELQTGRVLGAEEVALLQGARRAGQGAATGGGAALHGHRPAHRGDTGAGGGTVRRGESEVAPLGLAWKASSPLGLSEGN